MALDALPLRRPSDSGVAVDWFEFLRLLTLTLPAVARLWCRLPAPFVGCGQGTFCMYLVFVFLEDLAPLR